MAADPLRVAVYFADEGQRQTALDAVGRRRPGEVREFAGLVEGWVTPAELRRLLAAGLSVDLIDKASLGLAVDDAAVAPEARAAHRATELVASMAADHPLRRALDRFSREAERTGPPPVPMAGRRPVTTYRLRLRGRVSDEERAALAGLGVRLLAHEPGRWYRAAVPAGRLDALRALPFVQAVEALHPGDRVTADFLVQLERAQASGGGEPAVFDLTLHAGADLAAVRRQLAAAGADEIGRSGTTLRFRAPIGSPGLAALASMPEVAMLAPYRPATLLCDYGRAVIGVDSLERPSARWTGDGEVVAILDSGIDATHPDLGPQVQVAEALGGGAADDEFGHGTHVAGIVAGNGSASAGAVRGVAPGARLAVLKISDGQRLDLPADMGTLLQVAVDRGARIINLSFGVQPPETGAVYDRYSHSTDQFVLDHPDVLVVVAAGNFGTAPDGGFGFCTLASPATAKNVLTVGASLTSRPELDETWGQRSPAVFKLPPARDAPVAGQPDLPAASSSRGPGGWGMVKPDLLAPGTYILSARAAHTNPGLPWKDCVAHGNRYVYVGGSSMAAPFAAGAAAVVRHHLRAERGMTAPSAALLKAILIAAARRLPPVRVKGSPADYGYPDFDQGFGRLDLASVLPHGGAPPRRRLELADVANDSPEALESRAPAGSERRPLRRYSVTVADGAAEPLRCVLTWTDRPGGGVQNDLGLAILLPGGSRLSGNAEQRYGRDPLIEHPDLYGLLWDDRNTVEQVVIERPPAGRYEVRVVARNTLAPPQGYALAVCGELEAGLTASDLDG